MTTLFFMVMPHYMILLYSCSQFLLFLLSLFMTPMKKILLQS